MSVTFKVRAAVLQRAGWTCERCPRSVDLIGYSLQHRRARGMGGSRRPDTNAPQNLAVLCGSATTGCHGEIEANPALARLEGWRVDQGQNPETVPIRGWRGELYLLPDGTYGQVVATYPATPERTAQA